MKCNNEILTDEEGVKLAEEAIDSGKALLKVNQLIKLTNGGTI